MSALTRGRPTTDGRADAVGARGERRSEDRRCARPTRPSRRQGTLPPRRRAPGRFWTRRPRRGLLAEERLPRVEALIGRIRPLVLDPVEEWLDRERATGAALLAGGVAYRLFFWLVPLGLALAGLALFAAHDSGRKVEDAAKSFGLGAVRAPPHGEAFETEFVQPLVPPFWLVRLLRSELGRPRCCRITCALAWRERPVRCPGRFATLAFTGVALTTASLGVLSAWLRHYAPAGGLLVTIATVAGAAAIAVVALRLLPHGDADWRGLVPGALLIAVGMQAMHLFVVDHLSAKLERASELTRARASTVVLLWLYLTACGSSRPQRPQRGPCGSEGRGSRTQNFRDLARRGAELGGDDVGRELEVASEALDRVVRQRRARAEPEATWRSSDVPPGAGGIERGPAEIRLVVVGAPLAPRRRRALRLVGVLRPVQLGRSSTRAGGGRRAFRRRTRPPEAVSRRPAAAGGVSSPASCGDPFDAAEAARVRQRAAGGVRAPAAVASPFDPTLTSCHRRQRRRGRRPPPRRRLRERGDVGRRADAAAASTREARARDARDERRDPGPASVPSRSIAVHRTRATPAAMQRSTASSSEKPAPSVQPAVRDLAVADVERDDEPLAERLHPRRRVGERSGADDDAVGAGRRATRAASSIERMPPDAWSSARRRQPGDEADELRADAARARAVQVDEMDPAQRLRSANRRASATGSPARSTTSS